MIAEPALTAATAATTVTSEQLFVCIRWVSFDFAVWRLVLGANEEMQGDAAGDAESQNDSQSD